MDEFSLIQTYFDRPRNGVDLGVGDDAALVSVPAGDQLVVAADMLVENRHFFADVDPRALGHKALAVNLSDMAAMGAQPRWFTLCISLPEIQPEWVKSLTEGMFSLADAHGVALIGGDTTRGPLTLAVQILGTVPKGRALTRSGAAEGDDIWLSGYTGEAALAVQSRYQGFSLSEAQRALAEQRLDYPTPRVSLGLALRGLASAAIDVSDGLLADLGHVALQSRLQAVIQPQYLPNRLPQSNLLAVDWLNLQCTGGDDYEICFTASPCHREEIKVLSATLDVPLTRIGYMQTGDGVAVIGLDGQAQSFLRKGFNHFE